MKDLAATLATTPDFEAPEVAAGPPRVLLVDDCAVQRLMGTTLLLSWGVLPEVACDGLEAVLMAREQEFDLILMDLDMPVLDGLAATARIREHERSRGGQRHVPVVAYTSSLSALKDGRCRDGGMDAVMAKPSDVHGMGACLERWCPSAQFLSGQEKRTCECDVVVKAECDRLLPDKLAT